MMKMRTRMTITNTRICPRLFEKVPFSPYTLLLLGSASSRCHYTPILRTNIHTIALHPFPPIYIENENDEKDPIQNLKERDNNSSRINCHLNHGHRRPLYLFEILIILRGKYKTAGKEHPLPYTTTKHYITNATLNSMLRILHQGCLTLPGHNRITTTTATTGDAKSNTTNSRGIIMIREKRHTGATPVPQPCRTHQRLRSQVMTSIPQWYRYHLFNTRLIHNTPIVNNKNNNNTHETPLNKSQINLSSSTPKPTSTSTQPFSDIHNDAFIMRKAPRSWRPYIKLMRADRPAGTYLLMLPCFWGMGMGLASPLPPLGLSLLFATGAFVMRGAGCVINDLWDREYDRRVERTQGRPLASGELQVRHAMGLLAGQLGLGLMVLLSFNSYTVATVGAASLGLVVVYPLAKRVTYWPQIVLGLTFNWGVLVGYAAATGSMDAMVVAPLYMAAAAFTLVYDTIYAHQDKKDDITAGVKSTALLFGSQTSSWLLLFCLLFFAGLLISGWNAGQSGPYFGGITVASAVLVYFSLFTDFDNPDQCLKRFRHSRWISVLVMLAVYAGNAGGRRSGVPGHGTPRPDPNLE
eukprot:gb/GECH01008697.1/.p1 GENE.gb/GECH01008697.1/~~gb/GECH01008697.1/.p1  ORF type:complete len:580 (+),score=33.94 gb/GECH01008697.1/:1-1740(+)